LRQWQGGSIARFTLALCRRHPDRLDLALRLSVCASAPGEGLALFEAIGPRKAPETSVVTERLQHAREVQRLTLSDRESRERADELHGMLAQVSETTLRQIGQELHDDVGQILTGAAMLAGTMARSLAQRQQAEAPTAGRLAALLNDAVGKLRALSRGLFPIGLETAGLGAMLDALAMQLRASTPLDIQMQRAGDAPLLSQEQALQIYRIVQEAASNAVRHSGAKTLRLSFCGRPGALSVVVADDGFGIEHDRRQRGGGIGLRTMHARAARIGAGLRIHTPAEGGTRVELELPWPAAAAAVAA
jgi:signal transduction histidine kinase